MNMGICGSDNYNGQPYVPPNAQKRLAAQQQQGQAIPVGRPVATGQYGNNIVQGRPVQPPQPGYSATASPPNYSYQPPAYSNYQTQKFHDLRPGTDEIEPMLLLDTTGSMNFSTAPNSQVKRRSTVEEAIGMIVDQVAQHDSQAEHEQGDDDEGGGIRTITFADGKAFDIGDLNPLNYKQKWNRILWSGGTYIAVGWQKLKQVYYEEFGSRPQQQQPKLLALIITDGEAMDTQQFVQMLSHEGTNTYVVIALLGHGPDHDAATRTYQQLAKQNNHVRLVNFGPETDPSAICQALLGYIF